MDMPDKRFVFAGHAVGAAARFFHLDNVPVDHVVPTIGSSVIPITGGHTHHKVEKQSHSVDQPRKRTLVSVAHVETIATGKELSTGNYSTEIAATINGVSVLEKLHADLVEMHQNATRSPGDRQSSIKTSGCKIQGLKLGTVLVTVDLDEEPFATCGTKEELDAYWSRQTQEWRDENAWRFHTDPKASSIHDYNGRFFCTLVKKIAIDNAGDESIKPEGGYIIKWDGFGRIFLGEIVISGTDRTVSMIRLKMGSDAGGSGTIGGGQTNGGLLP